jgi:hypothetical protein
MMPFPLILLAIVVVLIWALKASVRRSQRQLPDLPRACIGCGMIHPDHANYCRHCGRRLS